ncbi:MAG TPA: nitroreductase family deazaflavin-dependent oxidoreductase [Polyangiales bacterium]|nr:nitroreductase family deazaflavin-dependent oxidoreductase [Polyangiales bacterium]
MSQQAMPEALKRWFNTPLSKLFQRANVFVYKASGAKLGGSMKGAPILLLTVRGRKSGKPHTLPLLYLLDGEDYVLVASKGGWPSHPLWYVNLQANPDVTVQVGRDQRALTARTANQEERARLWPKLVAMYSDYANYQSWTDREIPVVILSPRRR